VVQMYMVLCNNFNTEYMFDRQNYGIIHSAFQCDKQ